MRSYNVVVPIPGNNKQFDAFRDKMGRVGPGRLFFWFFAINLPIALGLSAMPLSISPLIRGAIALLAFAIGQTILLLKVSSMSREK